MMKPRLLAAAGLALAALAAPASAQLGRVVVAEPTTVVAPARAVYVAPAPTVYTQTTVTRVPVGPTAYVAPAPVAYVPARRVYQTTTVVPATTTVGVGGAYVVDRAVAPVGYEVVRPRRGRILFPRRVFRYGY